MTIMDRYIARMLLSGYAILLLVGMGMYILADLLVNIDEFTGDQKFSFAQTVRLATDYYGYNLPLYYSQLGGPMMAIAASFVLGVMLRNNEQTALVAAGVPLQRLVAPVLVVATLLIAVWMVNREVLIPHYAHKIARGHADIAGRQTEGVYCARDERNAILTALRVDPANGTLAQVYIIEPEVPGRLRHLIQADRAEYLPNHDPPGWRLVVGRRLVMRDEAAAGASQLGGPVRYEPVDFYSFGLGPDQLALRQASEWSDLLSVAQMNNLLRSRNLPNRPVIEMNQHVRLVQPLVQAVLLLLSLPFFLRRDPSNVLAAGGKCMLLTGAFFAVSFVAHSFVGDGRYAALLAWLPVLIFGPVAALNIANIKT